MPALDLIALLLILFWAALLFGGWLLGKDAQRYRRMPVWTRMASSAVLVLLGWYGFLLAPAGDVATYARWIAVGMSFGFVGDLLMAGLLPASNRVLGGIAAFGIGHVAYIAAIAGYRPVLWWMVALGLLAAAGLFYGVFLRNKKHSPLLWAALIYSLLLAATALLGVSLALQLPLFGVLAAGGLLFFASDLILGLELFNRTRFPYLGDWVWLTYGPGQALIVLSIWSALQTIG
ncbi:MAG: lysoplasmalogenase [Chloroflexi bacterium]|nr:lysoplasmalogenase [Chloroflexota bacterium]